MILSLVTSIKDYVEIVNKFIEYDPVTINYTELGSILTFFLISIKNCFVDFFSFSWLLKENLWSLPIIIPQISSAMISEISVLGEATSLVDPTTVNTANGLILCIEKLTIGLINSIFLFLPTSTAHIITLRRFVMQGLEAGYLAGLGTIAGNVFWLASVILGWRFFVIPWLSLDIFRYVLGFILLVKYMWDSYNEKTNVNTNVNTTSGTEMTSFLNVFGSQENKKIFLLNFLLALTEQTSLYAFVGNISMNASTSILDAGSINNSTALLFTGTHLSYLLGILLGSLSLLHFSCWFWENPAFKVYMWAISSFKISTNFYYKVLNFGFLYLTMLSAICSVPYYGLDYAITNPLGYVSDDRIVQDKTILETSFLGTKASDRNTRRNRGRHGRRERWKRRIRKYRAFDASLYDQGIYDLFTIEDLNYGFDRFWLRRKLRNHRVRFRFFPGPWMRSFKKQLAKPRLESYTGPRIEFFRILFEQVYHPSFHAYDSQTLKNSQNKSISTNKADLTKSKEFIGLTSEGQQNQGLDERNQRVAGLSRPLRFGEAKSVQSSREATLGCLRPKGQTPSDSQSELPTPIPLPLASPFGLTKPIQSGPRVSSSKILLEKNINNKTKMASLRKFVRKFDTRIKKLKTTSFNVNTVNNNNKLVYSKQWKNFIKNTEPQITKGSFLLENKKTEFNNLSSLTCIKQNQCISVLDALDEKENKLKSNKNLLQNNKNMLKKQPINLSKRDLQMLRYRLVQLNLNNQENTTLTNKIGSNSSMMLLHPLKFYLQKEAGFKRKLRYYTPNIYRKLSVENNAPYFRVMMRRYFYNYKPTLRWERTMKTASLRKARRKTTRIPRKLQNTQGSFSVQQGADMQVLQNNKTNQINAELATPVLTQPFEKNLLQKSTYNYSVVSKRANRYRYEIYKDVLQHWYYSPFNRFLLKLDVDSFIRRQPNSHFLTAKEENLLHLRRFLLCEHYNTLRWYTNMEHYRTMKTQLNGGTKSFASRAYNQQFAGTFKKIRHLFAITPSFSSALTLRNETPTLLNNSKEARLTDSRSEGQNQAMNLFDKNSSTNANILKFDQPLYNQYNNTSSNSILNPLIIHEELLSDLNSPNSPNNPDLAFSSSFLPHSAKRGLGFAKSLQERASSEGVSGDLISQSKNIVGQYLTEARTVRQDYIKKLLNENNYAELANFIYKGQKTRGSSFAQPVTNQKLFNEQEKNYLLTQAEQDSINNTQMISLNQNNSSVIKGEVVSNIKQTLYLQYLKNWKRHVNDQESLKNYLTRRLDKREKRKQKKEKQLITKLQRLENWFGFAVVDSKGKIQDVKKEGLSNSGIASSDVKATNEMLTSGLQKSILDGMISLKNIDWEGKSTYLNKDCSLLLNSDVCKTQNLPFGKGNNMNEKSLWKTLLLSKITLRNTITDEKSITNTNLPLENRKSSLLNKQNFVGLQDLTLRFNDLKYAKKIKLENNLKASVQAMREFVTLETQTSNKTKGKKVQFYTALKTKITSFSSIYLNLANQTAKNIYGKTKKLITSSKYLPLRRLIKPLQFKQNKSLNDWRKTERVLNKQKKSRKEFKLLNKKVESLSTYVNMNDLELAFDSNKVNQVNNENIAIKKRVLNDNISNFTNENINQSSNSDITENPVIFKRKRSAQRRSRVRRNRGVFKKRNLTDLLKKDFNRFYNNYTEKDSTYKNQYYEKFNSTLYGASNNNLGSVDSLNSSFNKENNKENFSTANEQLTNLFSLKNQEETSLKQRKAKQRKERYWKQKRSKYSQKRRKYRKRRAYTVVKIRALNKQFKRIKNQVEIQNWWWKQFIPSIQASNEALWQIEKDKLIQQKLSELSNNDILQRDNFNSIMQIGNNDFKPLALPYTIALQQANQKNNNNLNNNENNKEPIPSSFNTSAFSSSEEIKQQKSFLDSSLQATEKDPTNFVNKLYESLFIDQSNKSSINEFLSPNTNLPFYAGWDESLRKLVVTNRMLSRREAGFSLLPMDNKTYSSSSAALQKEEFTAAPLQGMNAATTLYWQIPFTTYDPDQFFALGMDGFSPIGWRRFLLRHSLLKTWLNYNYVNKSTTETAQNNETLNLLNDYNSLNKQASLVVKTRSNILKDFSLLDGSNKQNSNDQSNLLKYEQNKKTQSFAVARRLKKRYRRVKKHPRTPVWFPSGPLLNQVLPVHYIYVFYKRARLPRDRYIKRRLLNVKQMNSTDFASGFGYLKGQGLGETGQNLLNIAGSNLQTKQATPNIVNYDFTLRKRLKPKRKYHLKRNYYASNVVIPRRFKFMSIYESDNNIQKWRPLSISKINKPISEIVKQQQLLRRSAQQRSAKQQPNMRVKQLRRRVQRQILRSVWRYRPRAGGFVWPGDYLKLELVKAPKLQSTLTTKEEGKANVLGLNNDNLAQNTSVVKKQKRKKKRTLVEWQIQPKKYLREKHNLKVIKKKLLQRGPYQIGTRGFEYNKLTLNTLRNSIN